MSLETPFSLSSAVHHSQLPRRRAHGIAALNLQPTASPSFFSADSCKNLSTDTKADDKKMKELVSDDESHHNLDKSGDGGSPETQEATSSQKSPVGPPRAPVRVFSPQENQSRFPNSRPWHQSYFPILVVLVASFGTWLTGTNHVKNLFVFAFVVIYVYQLSEGPSLLFSRPMSHLSPVPWQLYTMSRPCTRPPDISPSVPSPYDDPACLATSELRNMEHIFLCCAFYTPLVSCLIISCFTDYVLGDSAYEFNWSLFLLAANLRTISHCIYLIEEETTELHNAIHSHSPNLTSAATDGDAYNKIRSVNAVDQCMKRQGQRCEGQEARERGIVEGLQGSKRACSRPALLGTTTTAESTCTLLSHLITPRTWFPSKPKPMNGHSPSHPFNSMLSSTSSESTAVQRGSVSEEEEGTPAPAAHR